MKRIKNQMAVQHADDHINLQVLSRVQNVKETDQLVANVILAENQASGKRGSQSWSRDPNVGRR